MPLSTEEGERRVVGPGPWVETVEERLLVCYRPPGYCSGFISHPKHMGLCTQFSPICQWKESHFVEKLY